MSEFPDGYVHDLSDEAIAGLRADVPAHLLDGLDGYVRDRYPVGHFLTALLENDLLGAYSHADATSEAALPALVRYLHGCLPTAAYGSPAKVSAWLGEKTRR